MNGGGTVVVDPVAWEGSCSAEESTLHQIAPYIGKMKSTMARALIESCSKPGDTVLDPFVGSGTVALESLLAGRGIIACDSNPYAVLLTKAKLTTPLTLDEALDRATFYLERAQGRVDRVSLRRIPKWVRSFFDPRTLREVLSLVRLLRRNKEYFLLGCLMGILHHQRPGFLSFPASHLVPYLRSKKFPREEYPELYEYRPVAARLRRKIARAYRRFPQIDATLCAVCERRSAGNLDLSPNTIDAVITSPPYMNALDYGRDNRLRLWFLGSHRHSNGNQDGKYTKPRFLRLMRRSLRMISSALKPWGKCVLVLGDVRRSGRAIDTAQLVRDLAVEQLGGFECLGRVEDSVPDVRRARKEGRCTKKECVVILQRQG